MDNPAVIWYVLVSAAVTAALRFAPFLIFGRGKETPELVLYLGKVLPFAIMGMLVVYCMKDWLLVWQWQKLILPKYSTNPISL